MAGKSPMKASGKQRTGLEALAASRERGEADRARAMLLTLNGWTSARIAEAFGVREDTVRLWRSDFMRDGIEALKASVAPGFASSRRFLRRQSPTGPTGRSRALSLRSRRAKASRLAGRSYPRRSVKRGLPLAPAQAHAEGTPECG